MRHMGAGKVMNEYAQQLPADLYASIPKAAFAAIAVSALTSGGDWLESAGAEVAKEWLALHRAGIVAQKSTALAEGLARDAEGL